METQTTTEGKTFTGEMAIMDKTGDTKIMWDRNNKDETENARKQFDHWRGKGYLAYTVKKNGEPDTQIQAFDATAEKIIFSPPLVGG